MAGPAGGRSAVYWNGSMLAECPPSSALVRNQNLPWMGSSHFRCLVPAAHTPDSTRAQIPEARRGTRVACVPNAPEQKIKGEWSPPDQPGKASAAQGRIPLPHRLRSRRHSLFESGESPCTCGNNSRLGQHRQPAISRAADRFRPQDLCVMEEAAISRAVCISPATSRPRSASSSSREPCSMKRSGMPRRRM
jgi:hypothetical protein